MEDKQMKPPTCSLWHEDCTKCLGYLDDFRAKRNQFLAELSWITYHSAESLASKVLTEFCEKVDPAMELIYLCWADPFKERLQQLEEFIVSQHEAPSTSLAISKFPWDAKKLQEILDAFPQLMENAELMRESVMSDFEKNQEQVILETPSIIQKIQHFIEMFGQESKAQELGTLYFDTKGNSTQTIKGVMVQVHGLPLSDPDKEALTPFAYLIGHAAPHCPAPEDMSSETVESKRRKIDTSGV